MKIAALLFCCLAFAAAAGSEEWKDLSVRLMDGEARNHRVKLGLTAEGKDYLIFSWENSKVGYGELEFLQPGRFPARKTLTVDVFYEGGGDSLGGLRLRLVDRRGEIFQYSPGAASSPGHAVYVVDFSKPGQSWGENKDGKFDFPGWFSGLAVCFKSAGESGSLKITRIDYEK